MIGFIFLLVVEFKLLQWLLKMVMFINIMDSNGSGRSTVK